jgi:hypothetical protein
VSDPLYDLVYDIEHNGIRWVTVIGFYTLYNKERRNHLLNKRDAALFHNLKILMEDRGLGDQWKDGPKIGLQPMDLPNLKQLSLILYKAILKRKLNYLRRECKMNRAWLITLVAYVLGAAAKKWGITFPDETANWVVDGVMMLIPVALAFMNKTKAPKEAAPNEPYIYGQSNK